MNEYTLPTWNDTVHAIPGGPEHTLEQSSPTCWLCPLSAAALIGSGGI
jgi:hypothetical protein